MFNNSGTLIPTGKTQNPAKDVEKIFFKKGRHDSSQKTSYNKKNGRKYDMKEEEWVTKSLN